MSLDPIKSGTEDLYEVSKIYMFGKPFRSLRYVRSELAGSQFNSQGENQRLDMPPSQTEQALLRDRFGPDATSDIPKDSDGGPYTPPTQAIARNEPSLARIYSFSYEGQYYKLPYPLIYLVWGHGERPDTDEGPGLPGFYTQNTGIEGKGWRFGSDIRVWKMDRHDNSMVIDIEVGTLKDILLEIIYEEEQGNISSRQRMASRQRMSSRQRMTSRQRMVGAHQD